jgi:hypothetical protein
MTDVRVSTSLRRPTNELAGRGRFVFEIVLSGGNRSSPSWNTARAADYDA